MRPAGGQQQTGGHAELGIDLADQLHAGLCAGAGVVAADHICRSDRSRVDAGRSDAQRLGILTCAGCGQGDDQIAVAVKLGDVVGVHFQGGAALGVLFHTDRVGEDAVNLNSCLHIFHRDSRCSVLLLVLLGVQNVHEDHRGDCVQLKAGINALTQGVLLKVVTEAQLLYRLCVAVCDDGHVSGRVRIFGEVDGGRTEHDLNRGVALNGGGQACGLFENGNAMLICHRDSLLSEVSCPASCPAWLHKPEPCGRKRQQGLCRS